MNLSIISPSENAYSETFIQQHKNIPEVIIKYYYGGRLPAFLEGYGNLVSMRFVDRVKRQIEMKLRYPELNADEICLLNSFKREQIQCVLAEYGKTGAEVLNVCRTLNIPLIVHFHGYDASHYQFLKEFKEKYKKMFSYASAIVVVSKTMEKKIIELGCPSSKIIYNPYGPDNSFFEIESVFKEKLFLTLGRFVDKKAPYYTILAFKKVLNKYPDAQLIMGGDGPLLDTCKNMVRYFEIGNNVIFPGVLSRIQFQEYLKNALAYVQHSLTPSSGDMEGTPVSILEASAAGVPVISTFHAGIPDVIIDGKTGLLCNEHDIKSMSDNMIKVIENLDTAKKLGLAGKKNIEENFSIYKHLDILKKAILNVKP